MSKKLDVSKLEGYPYTDGGKLEVVGVEPAAADMDDFISGNVREVTSDLEIIPDFAFSGKNGLRTLDLPNATYIGKYAASTPNLSASGSGSGSEEGGDESGYTFNNDNLTTVNMPKVVHICEGAFANDPNLVITELPDSVLAIDKDAFAGSPKVQLTRFPSNAITIMDNALPIQTNIDLDTIPESLTYLGLDILDDDNLQNHINDRVSFDNQILDCSRIPSMWFVVFDNYGPTFGKQYIENAEEIIFPENITNISRCAFYNCFTLAELTIPNSVTSIDSMAFYGCHSLTSLTIPNSVIRIGSQAFDNCYALTSLTIPNSVTSIDEHAFGRCENLTELVIPNSINGISGSAFRGCQSLTSLTIPDSVKGIGSYAFEGCESLISLTIPNSVTHIDNCAFFGCHALASLTIPKSVTSIGGQAFEECNALTDIYYSGTEEEWNAIEGINGAGFKGTETIHYSS